MKNVWPGIEYGLMVIVYLVIIVFILIVSIIMITISPVIFWSAIATIILVMLFIYSLDYLSDVSKSKIQC